MRNAPRLFPAPPKGDLLGLDPPKPTPLPDRVLGLAENLGEVVGGVKFFDGSLLDQRSKARLDFLELRQRLG